MASKPNVLLFGAFDIIGHPLAQLLVPPLPAEPSISHLRIVDKYSVHPPTTYLSKAFLKLLEDRKDLIEYRQGNLNNPTVVSDAFTDPAPNDQSYTHIIDATGEYIPGRPLEVYIRNVFDVSLLIARTSAAQLLRIPGSVKAHIRITGPFYHHTEPKRLYKEVDADGWKPRDLIGVWWHEMLRAVGSVEGLPLVVLRFSCTYGEGFTKFESAGLILLGLVYKHLGEEMKLLWSPDLPRSSINIADAAGIIWRAAEWISTKTRAEAERLAGAPLPPSNDPSVTPTNAPSAVMASAGSVVVPVFNVVDQGKSTMGSLSEVIGRVYGIKTGFYGPVNEEVDLEEIANEANRVHIGAWMEIITNSNPPVPDTPLSLYMHHSTFQKYACGLDGERIKTILQYECQHPVFDERAVRDYINWCRSEGIWPETPLYTAA